MKDTEGEGASNCRRERGMERDLAVEKRGERLRGWGVAGRAPVSPKRLGWDETTLRVSWGGSQLVDFWGDLVWFLFLLQRTYSNACHLLQSSTFGCCYCSCLVIPGIPLWGSPLEPAVQL